MVIRFPDLKDIKDFIMCLFGFLFENILEIIQGILVICFIVTMVWFMAFIVLSEPSRYSYEIDAQRYDLIDTWLTEEPEIKSFVMECLKNDTITYKEYYKIEDYKNNVHSINMKDSLKHKIRSK